MIAPQDVAGFLSDVMVSKTYQERIYEITGPRNYCSLDIAKLFGDVLKRDVVPQQILSEVWEKTMMQAGFSKDGAKNFMHMTQAVIDGKIQSDRDICLPTDFKTYLSNML